MPMYEYACRQCGHRFEAWQHMTDDPLTVCPKCGAGIHRVLFPAGIVFKGSGFYKTDNGSSSVSDKNGSAAGKSESGESKAAAEGSKSSKSNSSSAPSPASIAAD